MLHLSQSAIDRLYSAPRLILCEQSLVDGFRKAVPTQAEIVSYKGDTIGGSGATMRLIDFGLPVALEMIVAPKGCATAKELLALAQSTGFPRPISLVELPSRRLAAGKGGQLEILTAYQTAVEANIAALQAEAVNRTQELVSLRRRVEAQTLTNNHLSDFLGMLGYSSQELALEHIPELGENILDAPFTQKLPTVLSDISGVSVYASASKDPRRARISVGTRDNELFARDITIDRAGGWQDVFFPEGFLQQNHDGELRVEPLEGAPTFATADGIADASASVKGLPGTSAALRIWRHTDPRVHPLSETATILLPRPLEIDGNVLDAAAIVSALGGRRIEESVSLTDDGFLRTHPVIGQIANYVIRDVTLDNVEAVETTVRLTHPHATGVVFSLFVLPQASDDQMALLMRGEGPNKGRARATIDKGGRAVLSVDTSGFDKSLRYAVVLATESVEKKPRYATGDWQYVALRLQTRPQRQTYRFSYFAALANQIQYADGPILENQMNEQFFTMLAVSDGDRFLQTHPLENHVVGARLDSFVPKGLQRLWIDISNAHAEASPTEFGILLSPKIISHRFTDYYSAKQFADVSDDALHVLPGGALLKKTLLHALDNRTLNIFLTEPLKQAMHMYLFVKVRRGPVKYGWCRWHRVAMTVFSGQDAPENTNAEDE